MAQRAVRPETIKIDPVFFIPDGVDELQYTDGITVTDNSDSTDEDNNLDIDLSESGDDDTNDYSDSPEVPQILSIISQTIRMNAAGQEVVDVVFDVDPSVSGKTYNIRATPV